MKISYANRTSPHNLHLERLVYQKQRCKIIQKKNEPRRVEQPLTHQTEVKKMKNRNVGKNVDVYV
jgi:hypothetical protein